MFYLKICVERMDRSLLILGNICLVLLLINCNNNFSHEMFSNKGVNKAYNDAQDEKVLNRLDQHIQDNQSDKVFKIRVDISDINYQIEVIEKMKVGEVVIKLQQLYNKKITGLYFESSEEYGLLNNKFTLKDYGIKQGDQLGIVMGQAHRATNLVNTEDPKLDISAYKGKRIPVKSYHVSCNSYKPKKYMGDENLGGVVLYSYDDKNDWYVNGVHCKTGYIIVKRTSDVEQLKAQDGSIIHGNVYKSVFGVDPDKKIVGSGFSYHNGKWKYNSWSFNAKDDTFHTGDKSMNPLEAKYIERAMKNWIDSGKQNVIVKENLEILEVIR